MRIALSRRDVSVAHDFLSNGFRLAELSQQRRCRVAERVEGRAAVLPSEGEPGAFHRELQTTGNGFHRALPVLDDAGASALPSSRRIAVGPITS